jgi:hypothetical protein
MRLQNDILYSHLYMAKKRAVSASSVRSGQQMMSFEVIYLGFTARAFERRRAQVNSPTAKAIIFFHT